MSFARKYNMKDWTDVECWFSAMENCLNEDKFLNNGENRENREYLLKAFHDLWDLH